MDDEDFQIDLGLEDEGDPMPSSTVKDEPQTDNPEIKVEADEAKKPAAVVDNRPRRENIGTVVHITDMSWFTTDIEVEAACGLHGTVKNVKFFEDRSNGRSMGACAVEFNSMDEAKACISGLDGKQIGQDTVHVDWPGRRPPFKQRHIEPVAPSGGMKPGMPVEPTMPGPMGPMMNRMPGMPGRHGPMMGPMGPMGHMPHPMGPIPHPMAPRGPMGPAMRPMRGGMMPGPKRPKFG